MADLEKEDADNAREREKALVRTKQDTVMESADGDDATASREDKRKVPGSGGKDVAAVGKGVPQKLARANHLMQVSLPLAQNTHTQHNTKHTTHTSTHAHAHTRMRMTHACTHTCIHTCMHMRTFAHLYAHTHTRKHRPTHARTCTHTHTH